MKIIDPVRVERTYVQKLRGKPDEIFPLLCPVREKEWVSGWDPLEVYTHSGTAEKDCVFTTGEVSPDSIWVIVQHDPQNHRLGILKVTPGLTVGKISIALSENEKGETDAKVVYMYTAISSGGEDFVRDYSEEFFKQFMQYWESALNKFLENGKKG